MSNHKITFFDCNCEFFKLLICWFLIEPWKILRVLGSISSYTHDDLLCGNSVCTLWVILLAILLLSRNSFLTCLFFSLLARFKVYDICICFWMFERSNVWFCLCLLISYLFFICCPHLNMLVTGKRNCNHKTFHEKWQALKDLEKGMSKKDVAAKYGGPKTKKHLINLGQKEKKPFRFTSKRKQH